MVRSGLTLLPEASSIVLGFSRPQTYRRRFALARKVSDPYGAIRFATVRRGDHADAGTRVEMDPEAVYCRADRAGDRGGAVGSRLQTVVVPPSHAFRSDDAGRQTVERAEERMGGPGVQSTAAFGAGARDWSFLEGKSRPCRLRPHACSGSSTAAFEVSLFIDPFSFASFTNRLRRRAARSRPRAAQHRIPKPFVTGEERHGFSPGLARVGDGFPAARRLAADTNGEAPCGRQDSIEVTHND